jgi:hypothetical protein
LPGYAGDTKIGDSRVSLCIDHNVRWFEIAMQNAFVMCGPQPLTQRASDLDGPVGWNATDAAEQTLQVLPVNEFHRDESEQSRFENIENAAHIRV